MSHFETFLLDYLPSGEVSAAGAVLYEPFRLDARAVAPVDGQQFTEPELLALLVQAGAQLMRRQLTDGLDLVSCRWSCPVASRNWPATLVWHHFQPQQPESDFILGTALVCISSLLPPSPTLFTQA